MIKIRKSNLKVQVNKPSEGYWYIGSMSHHFHSCFRGNSYKQTNNESMTETLVHFTVVCLVTKPLNTSEARVDFVVSK